MSKLITKSLLSRFWTKAKDYIDTALTGKADSTHTHDYAASDHTHTGFAASNHTHNDYAAATHGHAQSEINGLENALAGKAASTHSHAYGDLTGKPTIPTTVAQLSDAGNYALKSDITNVYKYKGSKATVAELPTTGNTAGDVWDVAADGMNYAWDGSKWDAMGSTFTIETATTAEIDAIFE